MRLGARSVDNPLSLMLVSRAIHPHDVRVELLPGRLNTGCRSSMRRVSAWAIVFLASLWAALGCSGGAHADRHVEGQDGGVAGAPADSGPQVLDEGGITSDGCAQTSCKPTGGQYCGVIGDGCQGTEDCGKCPGDWTCDKGLCVGGPSCLPVSCTDLTGTHYCGTIGDGCGHALDCGGCGTIGDGCGQSLDC